MLALSSMVVDDQKMIFFSINDSEMFNWYVLLRRKTHSIYIRVSMDIKQKKLVGWILPTVGLGAWSHSDCIRFAWSHGVL